MTRKNCSCSNVLSCFSCFSAPNNPTSPSSALPNTAPRVDPQTSRCEEGSSSSGIPPAPSKVPSAPPCTPFEPAIGGIVPTEVVAAASSSQAGASGNERVGEDGSSSSKNDDATHQTVPDLTTKIAEDVDAVDGEVVDLDGLIRHISELLKIIEANDSSLLLPQRRVEEYLPATSKIFSKLKKFLFDAKDVIPGEAMKTAVDLVLKGMVTADLVTTPFVVVASILERFGDVGDNKSECITLLKEMIFLAKLVKQFHERPQLKGSEGISGIIKEATKLIVEGSILCCTQMKSSKFSKFLAASGNKEDLSKFKQKLRDMHMDMNAQMNIRLYDVNAPKKPRLSRGYPEHAVGMEEPVKEVLDLLEWGSVKKAVAVMLHGFGGMGKTTLADAVFSRADFEGCKYSEVQLFQNIGSKPDIIELQKSILKDLMGPEETIPDIRKHEDGQRELGYMLEKVPAFLYIDNVLGEKELRQLLPNDVDKAKKLRLLLTARDVNVGRACPTKTSIKIRSMKNISNGDALSFLKSEVLDEMEGKLNSSQIDNIIQICGGVPLMLTLVAKVLSFEEDKQRAYNMVMRDKQNVKGQTFGGKEDYFFAYDSLPDECKDPFLDVCFFFKGWQWDTVADIVGEFELDTLGKRALVTKGIDNAASVHDVILTIGYQKAEGTRFKFTSASQFDEFFKEKDHQGMSGIKGIWLNENKDPSILSASSLDSMCKSLRVLDLGMLTKVEGQCNKSFENLIFFQGRINKLPFDGSNIKKLKYLKYEPDELTLHKMPSSLRHMELYGNLLSPAFQISSTCLRQLRDLRILRLIGFTGLKKLPEEIGDQVKALQELNLSYCKSLEELPRSISRLQSLRFLGMEHCSSLKQLGEDFGSLKSLQALYLQGCLSLKQLAENFGSLKSLQKLSLQGCSSLTQLGEDFGSLTSLQTLDLAGCTGLKALPNNFEKLSSLRELNLSSCENLEDLPYGLGNLSSLVALSFDNCRKLRSIPDSIGQLKLTLPFMMMSHCLSLTELPDGFCSLSFIRVLALTECKSLYRLPNRFGELASLRVFILGGCSSLQRLPEGFGQLKYLELLQLKDCKSLEELCNDFHYLTSLHNLNLGGCESLKILPEDFHRLMSLQNLSLQNCPMLEGKSMDNVLKIKTVKFVNIQGSRRLLDRWAEIERESESWPFKEKVFTGQGISMEQKEIAEKNMLSQLELLLGEGREKPFHQSAPFLVFLYDMDGGFNHNFPWPLIEETIDDMQINFEMLYIGVHFDKLPPKAKNTIVRHVDDVSKDEVTSILMNMVLTVGASAREQVSKDNILIMQISMVEDGGGGKCRPCWKHLTKAQMEEFLVCNCRKYLQLKQLVETSQESTTELLRELFATGEAQTCTFRKAPSGNSKPMTCTAEELKGKDILLEMRSLDACYDVRLESLTQLYNTESNLEIISIPLVHRNSRARLDVLERFSRDIPWFVIQNPWAIPTAVKYFLMNWTAEHEEEEENLSLIKIIGSNGRVFTPSKPVMSLLDRWGPKAYPFTVERIEELKEEEWNQMETMSTLEFLFKHLECVSYQVKQKMLHRKVVCLYGGYGAEGMMKEFTSLIRNAFIRLSDSVLIIYIPTFTWQATELTPITDNIGMFSNPLEWTGLLDSGMEGMLLLNLSQHDSFRFWRRLDFLNEEMAKMSNRDTDQLGAMKKLFHCWENDNPWMILMDGGGKIMTESGKNIVRSCKGSTEDEASGLIELFIEGSEEQRKEALLKLEQLPDV